MVQFIIWLPYKAHEVFLGALCYEVGTVISNLVRSCVGFVSITSRIQNLSTVVEVVYAALCGLSKRGQSKGRVVG